MSAGNLGDMTWARVVESEEPLLAPAELYPDSTPEIIGREQAWMAPRFYDPASGLLVITIQSFLLKTRHHTILVDACSGNHKDRERSFFDRREWPWLEALAAAGAAPGDIDYVLCTHMHVDHVGWNTRLDDGRWVPTFPNAKYLFSRADWDYWQHQSEENALPRTGDYFQDSVLPVFESGQAQLVDGEHAIEDGVWIEPTPGHSPGHVSVRLRSGGKDAVMSGDLLHHPLQCLHPAWSTNFCWDQERSRATRLSFLESVADTETLVIPAHFPAPTAGYVESHAAAFRFRFDGE
jgi:glyoxylase-like metal-dependent hydrolase (beta-lactamase superfamily II)